MGGQWAWMACPWATHSPGRPRFITCRETWTGGFPNRMYCNWGSGKNILPCQRHGQSFWTVTNHGKSTCYRLQRSRSFHCASHRLRYFVAIWLKRNLVVNIAVGHDPNKVLWCLQHNSRQSKCIALLAWFMSSADANTSVRALGRLTFIVGFYGKFSSKDRRVWGQERLALQKATNQSHTSEVQISWKTGYHSERFQTGFCFR